MLRLPLPAWIRGLFHPKRRPFRKPQTFRPSCEALESRLAPANSTGTLSLVSTSNTTPVTIYRDNGLGQAGSINTFTEQFNLTYTSGGIAKTVNSFCIDLFNSVSVGDSWQVTARDDLGSAYTNGSQMSYIMQRWGQGALGVNETAAVQLALWNQSLNNHTPTYFSQDVSGNYNSGDPSIFNVTSLPGDAAAITALVNQYISAAAGAAAGSWFDGSAAGKQSFIMPLPPPPNLAPDSDCGCSGAGGLPQEGANQAQRPSGFSNRVRQTDGAVKLAWTDLSSTGFGTPWGQSRNWTNAPYATVGFNGSGMVNTQQPYLLQVGSAIAVITSGTDAFYFDESGGIYTPRHFDQNTLTNSAGQFTFTDSTGAQMKFWDFSTSRPLVQRGGFQSYSDPAGNLTQVTARTADGKIAELQRTQTIGADTSTESYLYTYIASGANAGLLANVTLRRKINAGPWSTVRQVDYAYYVDTDLFGSLGDLKSAIVKDAAAAALDTTFYRYYKQGDVNGYGHGLKYVFGPQSYARAVAAGFDPAVATDIQVSPFADLYLEFAVQAGQTFLAVSKLIAQGEGCSACGGGLGAYASTFATSTFADGYNSWKTKTVETLPDGNQNIAYTNAYGQVMLQSFKETSTGNQWLTFHKYDTAGREILTANPSAITGYDDTFADLLNSVAGNYQYLNDAAGLISTTTYYTGTTATETIAGGVLG